MAVGRDRLQLITITNGVPEPGTIVLSRSGMGQVQWASADYAYVLSFAVWPFKEAAPESMTISVPEKGLTERYGIKSEGSGEVVFSYTISAAAPLESGAPPLGPIIVGDD